jgi:hypothetical protein
MQLQYRDELQQAIAGLASTIKDSRTYFCVENLLFGKAIVKATGNDKQAQLPSGAGGKYVGVTILDKGIPHDYYPARDPLASLVDGRIWVRAEQAVTADSAVYVRHTGKSNVATITLNADLVAANTFNITVDGVSIAVLFDTNHATTMAAIVAAIQAQATVVTATSNTGGNNRVITVTSVLNGEVTVLSGASVTGGASQAGVVIATTTAGVAGTARGDFRGDADAATAELVTWAKFLGTRNAEGLVEIQLLPL